MTQLTTIAATVTASATRRRTRASRTLGTAVAVGTVALALALTGCVPEPGPGASNSPVPGASQSPSNAPSSPAPTPSAAGEDLEALPGDCEALYSPAMLQSLTEANPPLNHPGVTMDSTEVVAGLELLGSGVPTLRCSWGGPSGYGLATNVTLVTPEQAEVVTAALREGGFACVETGAELRCEMTKAFEEPKVTTGETHVFRANVWVSTRWINFNPTGYTDDIVAQLFA